MQGPKLLEFKSFFATEDVMRACNAAVQVTRRKLNTLEEGSPDFICFKFIGVFLFSAGARPDLFDANMQFNIEYIGGQFLNDLSDFVVHDGANKEQLFVYCYRMGMEFDISQPNEVSSELRNSLYGVREYGKDLSGNYAFQFEYAGQQMAIQIVKRYLYHPSFTRLVDLPQSIESAEKVLIDFNDELDKKASRAELLKSTLESYTTAFNFVGLNEGFQNLRDGKLTAARINLGILFFLGLAMAGVPVAKLVMDFMQVGLVESYGFYLSALGLELVLIFFFKVCLHNFKSIKAQLLQIDLRMTLCQFIQDYARYASEIKSKDKDLLSGFEKIVFSGIVTSEESIPSTFDGIEKIAEIVAALKK